MKTKTYQKEKNIESSTDTASQNSECNTDNDCVCLLCWWSIWDSLWKRIPLSLRKYILKVLHEMEDGEDTDSVVESFLALPVSEEIIVVNPL